MKQIFLTSIAKAANTVLRLDPESSTRLKKLQGKTITVNLLPMHFIFQWVFTAKGIELHSGELIAAETKITGTPWQMFGVMLTKDSRHQFFADDLIIEGNAELGQQVVQLFDELEIDWEEQLSHIIGDVPSHQAGRFAKGVKNFLAEIKNSFIDNVNEYVHEEAKWLPTREALQDFFHDIDQLRMDVDRVAAKIENLKEKSPASS